MSFSRCSSKWRAVRLGRNDTFLGALGATAIAPSCESPVSVLGLAHLTAHARGDLAHRAVTVSRLKQLHEVPRSIIQENLRAAGSGHDIIAEPDSGRTQSRDLAQGLRLRGKRHQAWAARPSSSVRLAVAAAIPAPRRRMPVRRWKDSEAEMFRITTDRRVDVVDSVAEVYRCL
jgi:hypothetical protein